MASKFRQSLSSGCRGESSRVKDRKEVEQLTSSSSCSVQEAFARVLTVFSLVSKSPPVPDSTTEPAPLPVQRFQEGDEVFFQTDTGQQMLGTVAEVRGGSCLVQFGDGTEQVAQFKRLRKLFEDEEADVVQCKRKKAETTPPAQQPQPRPQQTCTSCGAYRRITASKAKLYQNELRKFECRRCLKNKLLSQLSTKPLDMSPTPTATKGKLPGDISGSPIGSPSSGFLLPSKPLHNSPVSIPRQIQFSIISTKEHYCFSCEQLVQTFDSVGCNFCERPCHLSCLHLNPTPLNGDTFWHLVCSTCGNQKASEKVEMKFSVRRSISNWGDIAYLLISCLSVVQTHRMFDFEREMLPFMDRHLESLHLPRQYKSQPAEARNRFILNALQSSPQRFQNGKDYRLKSNLWGIRENDFPGSKEKICSQIVSKQSVKAEKPAAKTGSTPTPPPSLATPSPDLIRFIASTKIKDFSPSPSPVVKTDDTSDTTSRSDTTESTLERDWATATEETRSDIFPMPAEARSESSTITCSSSGCGSSSSASSTISSVSSVRSSHKAEIRKEKNSTGMRNRAGTLDATEEAIVKRKAKATEKVYRKRKYSEGSISPLNKSSSASNAHGQRLTQLNKRPKTEGLSISPPRDVPIHKGLIRTIEKVSSKGSKSPSSLKSVREATPDTDKDGEDKLAVGSLKLRINIPSKSGSQPYITKSAGGTPLCLSPIKLPKSRPKDERMGEIDIEKSIAQAFALKAAVTSPLSPLQIQKLRGLDDEIEKSKSEEFDSKSLDDSTHEKRIVEVKKEKIKKEKSKVKKSKISKASSLDGSENTSISRNSGKRGPGRPKGSSAAVSPVGSVTTKVEPIPPTNRTLRQTKSTGAKPANNTANNTVPIVSRRVGTFNSISEKRPEPIVKQDSTALNQLNQSFIEAALFGDYRIQCLPSSPLTEAERRTETLKVFSHIRTEKETEIASSLLGRSEVETRSLTRRKSELFVGRQKHDLNDFDSYEVLGKRVDADGITRYQVLWKRQDEEFWSDEDDELEKEIEQKTSLDDRPFAALNLFANSPKIVDQDIVNNTESLWAAIEKCPLLTPS